MQPDPFHIGAPTLQESETVHKQNENKKKPTHLGNDHLHWFTSIQCTLII